MKHTYCISVCNFCCMIHLAPVNTVATLCGPSGTQEPAESAGECGSVRKGKEDERAEEVW